MPRFIILSCLLITILFGCNQPNFESNNKGKSLLSEKFHYWKTHVFYLPQGLKSKNTSQNRIISIFDVGCSSCLETINDWKVFQKKFDKKVKIIFVIRPEVISFYNTVSKEGMFNDFDVYIDHNDEIFFKNKMTQDKGLQTFLINNKGKVILIGNPVVNKKIEALYLRL